MTLPQSPDLKTIRQIEKEAVKRLNEVKVLLVGDGSVGKTSLAKRMMGMTFAPNEAQTHGIQINTLMVKQGETEIKVHLWDFGGQEIMHATHQFFLSRRSLYILVLDGRKDEKTEYWLKHIESFGGDSPVLVVINKIDENPAFDVNRKFLMDKYINIQGFFRISCKTKEGMDAFLASLTKALLQIDILKTTWPVSWFNVKSRLENMREPFISYTAYRELCVNENITDKSSQDNLLDFLNALGVILHFKDLELVDIQVLDLKWVTEAVYKILNARQLAKSNGVLRLELLDEILKQKYPGDYFYPPDKYRYIIGLMNKFELCYQLDDGSVLIPNLLEVWERDFDFDFDYAASLKFIIQYDFLPQSVMPRFTVRMHKDIKDALQWRTGVVLEDKAFHATAVIKADERDGRIYIYVNGDQKRDYFSIIRKTIRDINSSFEKLKTIELVPLPDNAEITVEYAELIGYERMGKPEIFIGKLGKTFSVSQLLDGIEGKSERRHSFPREQVFINIEPKINFAGRKKILAINSPGSISLEEHAKLFKLYQEAQRLEEDKKLQQAIKCYDEIIEEDEYFIKAWEGLERIYNSLGENDKREKALERIRFISNIKDFETNAAKKINLRQIQLFNLGFYGNFSWEFQPQINILLGKNGFGKSHLLRLLISLLQSDDNSTSAYFFGEKKGAFTQLRLDRDQQDKTIHFIKSGFKESIGKVPVLAIPDTRFLDKSKISVSYMEDEKSDLREYGAYHFLYNKPYEAIIQNFLYELCIKYMNGGKSFDIPAFKLLHRIVRELADKGFQFHQITPIGNAKFEIKVITEGNENNPLPIQYASQGTLSILSIFGLIYEYLNNLHQGESSAAEDVLKKPGIVFIDELDAHLHPTWQRKMIKLLRENFPNVQFFVTAHSPLVVAGCFAGEAAVLRKEKDGFVVENLYEDFIGYETRELFQKIFEVEDKDDNYLYYMAMSPFQDEIKQEISRLEQKRGDTQLTQEEEHLLKESYNDLDRIETALDKAKSRNQYDELSIENLRLKVENKKLLAEIKGKE